MSKVVLHIGTHKTATTSIQNAFWKHASVLEQHGIIYPRLGDHKGHHGCVVNQGQLSPAYRLETGGLDALAEIAARYADGAHTVFLSTEEFSRGSQLKEMGKLRAALSAFDEIEVVCVLRTQWQFLQSIYLQVSKTRISPRPSQLVAPVFKGGMHEGLWIDYNGILDALEKVFDSSEINFFDFAKSCQAGGGMLGHMLDHLGAKSALAQMNFSQSNVSPLSLASWAANVLSEPEVAKQWLVDRTSEALKTEFGEDIEPCLFTRQEFERMKSHYAERNAELHSRRASVQPDFEITPASTKPNTLFREDITRNFWVEAARAMVRNL